MLTPALPNQQPAAFEVYKSQQVTTLILFRHVNHYAIHICMQNLLNKSNRLYNIFC